MFSDMDGPTAACALRKRGYERPIIGVTGNVLKEDVDFFMEQGATTVLGKPLRPAQVKELLRGW